MSVIALLLEYDWTQRLSPGANTGTALEAGWMLSGPYPRPRRPWMEFDAAA
jgi:hypothetical protein